MHEKILGRTGLKVKTLGFGGIPIQRVSKDEAIDVILRFYKRGLNYYDTARGYTTSEERLGEALEDVREKVYFATKSNKRTAKEVRQELATSLKNLRTDYIDVYQLHNVTNEEQWNQVRAPRGAYEALIDAKDEEKIRHISVTSHNPELAIDMVQSGLFESLLIPYSYLATEPEKKLLPLCNQLNVGTISMKPFGGGAFSNANIALKYVLANPYCDLVIPGMATVAEVEENYRIWMGDHALSEEEQHVIQRDLKELGTQFCRGCEYCQPCPQEIPISVILRTETQFLRRMGWSESRVMAVKNAKTKLENCAHCGTCESRCPYGLPIQELLPQAMDSLWNLMENRTIP